MTGGANSDQAEYWSGPSGKSWITHEDAMDHLLSPVVALLLQRAGDVRGLDVLDIGCGTGALSLAFAEAGARVLACDISAPLLSRSAKRGDGRFGTLLADAAAADWPRRFDLAVSRFGVMFFADPAQAFANIGRALVPGGRMLFAAWAPSAENFWWRVSEDTAARRMGVTPVASNPHAPGPMGLSDRGWALERFRAAGLAEAQCEAVDIRLPGGSATEAAELATRLGPGGRILGLNAADEADRQAVAAGIAEVLRDHETNGQVNVPARVFLYSARRP